MVKCVVWDLDNTVWDGVLLEHDRVSLRPNVPVVIQTLDRRGVLNSIASRNDHGLAVAALKKFGLWEYFLYPQINWNAKSSSIQAIAKSLNISTDAISFIDDEPYEREEVAFSLPEVLCVDARDTVTLLDRPEFIPPFITEDSQRRRLMYLADQVRNTAEDEFTGPKEEFLASLGMTFRIALAREEDLQRAEELTVRTNQLNATGYTYSYHQLNEFRNSDQHKLLIAGLDDKYGPYGNIGLALIEITGSQWTIKLLLMSCRVMSRGVGAILINYIKRLAKGAGARLYAEFVPTGRNRMMYVAYKFSRFKEIDRRENLIRLEGDLDEIGPLPSYVRVNTDEG